MAKSKVKESDVILCKCGIKYKFKNKEKHEDTDQHKQYLISQFIVYFE